MISRVIQLADGHTHNTCAKTQTNQMRLHASADHMETYNIYLHVISRYMKSHLVSLLYVPYIT